MRNWKWFCVAGGLLATVLSTNGWANTFTGPSSSQSPYVVPTAAGVEVTSILTVGDAVGGYAMVGIPDGLGAYDNGDDTFTILMNHELPADRGVVRAHGATGAFVSEWVVKKSDFSVVSGGDLATSHMVWDSTTSAFVAATGDANRFGRLCAADLPAVSAFYDANSGLGTRNKIFMNGEEAGAEGRGYGFVATGDSKGIAYELPRLGNFSWENSVANPFSGAKTVVVGLDDSTPGQVYVYVGDKQANGNDIEKAGLNNGSLFGVRDLDQPIEGSVISGGFELTAVDWNQTGAALQSQSNTLGVTNFARPEDGQWSDADTFYFVTTGADPDGNDPLAFQPSRLYRVDFNANLTGGEVSMVLDASTLTGTDGAAARSFDNMTIDENGNIYIQEDPGNNAYIAKTWMFDPTSGEATQLLASDTNRFITGAPMFLTQDEENSGVIEITSVLGRNDGRQYFLADMQAHYPNGDTLIEGGQLYVFSQGVPEPTTAVLLAIAALAATGRARKN